MSKKKKKKAVKQEVSKVIEETAVPKEEIEEVTEGSTVPEEDNKELQAESDQTEVDDKETEDDPEPEQKEIVISPEILEEIGSPDKEEVFKKVAKAYEDIKRSRAKYKKAGPTFVIVSGVVFLFLMFAMEYKVAFLILWIATTLFTAALMIRAEYNYHQFKYYLGLAEEESDENEEVEGNDKSEPEKDPAHAEESDPESDSDRKKDSDAEKDDGEEEQSDDQPDEPKKDESQGEKEEQV